MRSTQTSALVAAVAAALSIGHLAARLPLLSSRRFDPDELEHAHVAWCILHGAVPFRDFFEHHTPLFHYVLAAFFRLADPDRSPARAMQVLFEARYLTWAVSAGIVIAVFWLARRLRDATTAWVALPIATGSVVMALRALEIRPDGLSTLLWLLCLLAWTAALDGEQRSGRVRTLFAASGLGIGLAVLASQKLLVAGLPMAVMTVWYLVSPRFGGARRDRLTNVACQLAAVIVVWSIALSYFAAEGAAGEFVRLTLLQNMDWASENSPATVLAFVVRYDPWLFPLTAAGAVLLVAEAAAPPAVATSRKPVHSVVMLLLMASGLFAGLWILPVPYPQYCLTFVPLFAIIAASGLVETARALSQRGRLERPSGAGALALALFAVVALVDFEISRPVVVAPVVYPLVVTSAIVALFALPVYRRANVGLAIVLLALSVLPAQWTRWMQALGDGGQFAEIRYVLDHAPPGGTVLDGWSGDGVFRRHTGYYWMFHPGVRAMLPASAVTDMLGDLRSGRDAARHRHSRPEPPGGLAGDGATYRGPVQAGRSWKHPGPPALSRPAARGQRGTKVIW